ncbi:hypothetical protein O181_053941 [Austropuccinia psidii MF-1]|uniref:Uncharacterized protein n=1 Tax=Austropuccinia psidii MF-1 TaxID=1389203 RepID=A0A9Q3HQM6_9BASI|nr:hypothetical protein [Austropuccinia psidii MF-1]
MHFSSNFKNNQLKPFESLLINLSEFNKIVSDPKFHEPWKNNPTQYDWPPQHSADIQHKASWLEHTPKNSADSTSSFLPSHVQESPLLSPPIQNPQDILPSKTFPRFSTETRFASSNYRMVNDVSPQSSEYAGGVKVLPENPTVNFQFSNQPLSTQSTIALLAHLTSRDPINIARNFIWPPDYNLYLESSTDILHPFTPWNIWRGDEMFVPHFKEHDKFIDGIITLLQRRGAEVPRGQKMVSSSCKTLQVQYSVLKSRNRYPELSETGFLRLIFPSGGKKSIPQISEKLIPILRRTLLYYLISESLIFGSKSTQDVSEISKWLMAQFFDPQKGLPVFGKTQKKVSTLSASDFGITQKIFLLTFANSSPGSIDTGALSLVAAWYKEQRIELWEEFKSDKNFLQIMASYLILNWPKSLRPEFLQAAR